MHINPLALLIPASPLSSVMLLSLSCAVSLKAPSQLSRGAEASGSADSRDHFELVLDAFRCGGRHFVGINGRASRLGLGGNPFEGLLEASVQTRVQVHHAYFLLLLAEVLCNFLPRFVETKDDHVTSQHPAHLAPSGGFAFFLRARRTVEKGP